MSTFRHMCYRSYPTAGFFPLVGHDGSFSIACRESIKWQMVLTHILICIFIDSQYTQPLTVLNTPNHHLRVDRKCFFCSSFSDGRVLANTILLTKEYASRWFSVFSTRSTLFSAEPVPGRVDDNSEFPPLFLLFAKSLPCSITTGIPVESELISCHRSCHIQGRRRSCANWPPPLLSCLPPARTPLLLEWPDRVSGM